MCIEYVFVFFNDTATTEIYTYLHTLSLHDALPIYAIEIKQGRNSGNNSPRHYGELNKISRLRTSPFNMMLNPIQPMRSEEHTSELQSLMRISYAVFCLKKKITLY